MSLLKEGFVGDVTALEICSTGCGRHSFLLAGMGPMLYVYDLHRAEEPCLLRRRVLEGARIHGFATSTHPATPDLFLLVCGDRFAKLCSMEVTEADEISLTRFTESYSCPYWILDAVFVPNSAFVVLALSNNTVQVLSFLLDTEEGTLTGSLMEQCYFCCEVRAFLFSAALQCQPSFNEADVVQSDFEHLSSCEVDQEQLLERHRYSISVASGTAFGETIVWKCILDLKSPSTMDGIAPAFCLRGHAGAVLRLRWIEDGTALLSVSEDRTVAAWDLPRSPEEETCREAIEPRFRRFGHQARVWDVCCWQSKIVTCSEDCSFKVWNLMNGDLISSTQAHTGRGVWRCRVASDGTLVTGGADASIQLWPEVLRRSSSGLSDCLEMSESEETDQSPQTRVMLLGLPPFENSTDFVRCLCISRCCLETVYVFTNKGVVNRWKIDVQDTFADSSHQSNGLLSQLYRNGKSCLSCACHLVKQQDDANCDLIAIGGSGGVVTLLLVTSDGDLLDAMLAQAFDDQPALSIHIQETPVLNCFSVSATDSVSSCQCMQIYVDCDCRLQRANCPVDAEEAIEDLPSTSSSDETPEFFSLDSPLQTRLINIAHCFLDDAHLVIAGDVKGSVFQWKVEKHEPEESGICTLMASFRQVYGKQAVGMIHCDPGSMTVCTAAKHFAVQQFNIVNYTLQKAGESRLRDISTVEYVKKDSGVHLVAGFCQSYFYLFDVHHGRRIIRLDTGGRNRLHDFCVMIGEICCEFAFASLSNSVLQFVYGSFERSPEKDAFNRHLHFMSHGRETNDVKLLPSTERQFHQRTPVFTVSEDGRMHLLSHCSTDVPEGGFFESCHEIGVSPIGASMKTLSVLWCDWMDGWIVVSAGSKQVIMTWLIKEGKGQLESSLLSSQTLSAGGLRPRSNRRPSALDAELRFLASKLAMLEEHPLLFLASSDARLHLFCFDSARRRWQKVAELKGTSFPVLALDCLEFAWNEEPGLAVVAGTTSGQVEVWNVTRIAELVLASQPGRGNPLELASISSYEELHQSGVNCLSLQPLHRHGGAFVHRQSAFACQRNEHDAQRWLLVTGGDDQCIAVASVCLCPPDTTSPLPTEIRVEIEVLQRVTAHSSAVRGLWFDGSLAFSVGLDQGVVCWAVSESGAAVEVSCSVCEVPEPKSLDALRIDQDHYMVVVSGRGSQFVRVFFQKD